MNNFSSYFIRYSIYLTNLAVIFSKMDVRYGKIRYLTTPLSYNTYLTEKSKISHIFKDFINIYVEIEGNE